MIDMMRPPFFVLQFWMAILAVISVLTSVISASGQSGQISTNESYYI